MNEKDLGKMWHDVSDDELLSQVAPQPGSPDVSVLSGVFLGRGLEENALRLYTNMDLSQYYQVPRDKILGAKRMAGGRVVVWVPSDLRVQLITSQTMAAEFLGGGIQSTFMRRTRGSGSFAALLRRALVDDNLPFTRNFDCVSNVPDPSYPECGISVAGCPPPPQC